MTTKKLKKIAVVGKKNVGKSSLINILSGKQRLIVDDYPGLTRDIIEVEIYNYGIHALFYDLPGLDVIDLGDNNNQLEKKIIEKSFKFIQNNLDLIIHLMEPPAPSSFDYDFRDYYKKNINIEVIHVLNKIDSVEKELEFLPEFFSAGFQPIPISVHSRYNFKQFINILIEKLPQIKIDPSKDKDLESKNRKGYKNSTVVSNFTEEDIRIVIVGKPNVGKSTLFNLWAGKEISMVSDVPGTTRDTMDTIIRYFGKTIRILDTAGLRKKTVIKDYVEFISIKRTERAIMDSDIILHMISAPDGLTEYDKKIISLIQKYNRPMILYVNKWDLIPKKHDKSQKEYLESLYYFSPFVKKIPIFFGSAFTKKRAMEPLKKIIEISEKLSFRIPTAKLNRYMENLLRNYPHNQKFKIYYSTQIQEKPPIFVLFCNNKKMIQKNFLQYIENKISEDFQLNGIPIRIKLKEKHEN